MKRARSATKRNQEQLLQLPNPKPTSGISRRSQHLLLAGDTSSSDLGGDLDGIENRGYGGSPDGSNELEYANERIEQIQRSMLSVYRCVI